MSRKLNEGGKGGAGGRERGAGGRERGAGGRFNLEMDRYLIQGGGLLLPVTPCEETRIRSSGPE